MIIHKNILILYKGMLEKCSLEFLNSDELDINAKFQNWYSIIDSLFVACSLVKLVVVFVTCRRETPKKA